MKSQFNLTASILVIFLTHAPAATFTWDTVAGDSALTGGSGAWDNTNALWSEDAGLSNVTWPSVPTLNDDAVFAGTGGIVSVAAGGITVNDIAFQVEGYSIQGETLFLNGASPTIAANANASINSIITGSSGLIKTGTGNLTLEGANTYTGTTTIGAGSLVLGTGASLASSGNLSITGTASFNVGGNTQTLANLSISASSNNTTATLSNGALTLDGASALTVAPGVTTGSRTAEIDASALSSLTINKPSQSITIGGTVNAASPGNYGMLKLSSTTNTITAANLNIGTTSGANASGVINKGDMELGTTNTIYADNWTLGNTRDGGIVRFRAGLTNPTATLRASNGTSPVTKITIGQNGAGSTGVGTSSLELASGAVDIQANEIVVSRGYSGSGSANGPAVNGYFSFGGGTVTAGTVWLSKNEAGGRNTTNTSHLYHLGGNAKINSLVFGQTTHTGAVTTSTTAATFNAQYTLSAGELRAAEIKAGTGSFWTSTTRRINFNDGTIGNYDSSTDLTINGVTGTGGSIAIVLGSSGTPTFHADAGRIVTVGAFTAVSGAGSLTKTGAGQLTIGSAATFSGDTKVMAGSLLVTNGSALASSTLDLTESNLGNVSFDGVTAVTMGGIKGSRSLSLLNTAQNAASLTVGQNNQSTVYTGAITGSSAIRKIGNGILEYDPGSGHSSTLAGLNVSGGTLHLKTGTFAVTGSAATSAPDSMSGLIVSRGGTLRVDGANITATGGSYVFTAGNTLGGANQFILDSGTFDAGLLEVLNAYGATGTFTINQGQFSAGEFRVSQSATGTVNLNGGVLRVTRIKHSNNVEIVNLNGGTLQARASVGDLITAEIDNVWVKSNGFTVDTNGFNATIPKLLAGDPGSTGGGLTKIGAGMLTLTAANTYTGNTRVNHGELRVNVDHSSATGNVLVGDGEGSVGSAILSGSGTLGGAIIVHTDGAIAPGNGIGQLNTSSNVTGTGRIAIELDGATADRLEISGSGTIDISGLNLQLTVAGTLSTTPYVILDSATPISGSSFASVSGLPDGYRIVYDTNLHQVRMEQNPPTSGFSTFAETITDATKRARLADADGDGINNLLEYTLAGDPNVASSGILPNISQTDAHFIFRFKRSDASENDVTQVFQWSTNLQDWNDIALGTTSAGNVVNTENAAEADDITISIPKSGNTRIFGRLRVVTP
ncbi:MAG: hypothetical protein RI957_129 [Verrucomicrobiota bacterium]